MIYIQFREITPTNLFHCKNKTNILFIELIITDRKAIIYPILASVMMLCLFYFFGTFSFLVLIMTIFTSVTSMVFALYPLLERYFPSLTTREVR